MPSNNRQKTFLQVLLTIVIVLVLVIAFELLSQSAKPGDPGVLAANPQVAISETADLSTPAFAGILPTTLAPTLARPDSNDPEAQAVSPTRNTPEVLTATPLSMDDPNITAQPTPTLYPGNSWTSLPIIPAISSTTRQIYQKGLALGNNPNAFSKVGDCNSLSVRFLTYFDKEPAADYYNLESYTNLLPVIDVFRGSFKRESLAVGDGFNTSAILSPFRADPQSCETTESPLECEYRVHKPGFAFIIIGTDDYLKLDKFEANVRKIVEISIERGVVPILATKADTANQLDYNPILARVAEEYGVPLWNLWLAHEPLPYHGLADNMHPNGEFAAFDFSAANLAAWGWPVRNLTALQMLDAVWQGVSQ